MGDQRVGFLRRQAFKETFGPPIPVLGHGRGGLDTLPGLANNKPISLCFSRRILQPHFAAMTVSPRLAATFRKRKDSLGL
jgi:hypothetical protein